MVQGRRVFTEPERAQLLHRVTAWRQDYVNVWTRAVIGSPVYEAVGAVTEAIDGVAEAVTGDRQHLHARWHSSSPGSDTAQTWDDAAP